jgi:TAT (twin-arginine translocation) pathway signal sequence
MNRRQFLQSGIATAAAVAALAHFPDDYEIPTLPTTETDAFWLSSLSLFGCGNKSAIAHFIVKRAGTDIVLLKFAVNEYGSASYYLPTHGMEIFGAMNFKCDGRIQYEAVFTNGKQSRVYAGNSLVQRQPADVLLQRPALRDDAIGLVG